MSNCKRFNHSVLLPANVVFSTVQQVRYRILGNFQPMVDRTIRRIDTNPHLYAPSLGTVAWDTSLHVEPGMITAITSYLPPAIK
jgi:hypothetical protein